MSNEAQQVRNYLQSLQQTVCAALENADGGARFVADPQDTTLGGISIPCVLENGQHIERAGVNFTHSIGASLPSAATARRPELSGRGFQAVSLSLIVHPTNPYAPTTHANFRFFVATKEGSEAVWWIGGGYDLTPYYGFDQDAVHFHQTARDACQPFGPELYPRMKAQCDEYFFLPHRNEPRGIGGVFFDDFRLENWDTTFAFMKAISGSFLSAYLPIFERRKNTEYSADQRDFQLYRRGRYVEFNLLHDRGTKYGVQSGRRIEAVMCSMPPMVRWTYNQQTVPGSPEAALLERFLVPRDWANER